MSEKRFWCHFYWKVGYLFMWMFYYMEQPSYAYFSKYSSFSGTERKNVSYIFNLIFQFLKNVLNKFQFILFENFNSTPVRKFLYFQLSPLLPHYTLLENKKSEATFFF